MPQFTDEKRTRIREALLDAGHDRFVARGLAETTIAELTDDVGIASGTFYSFFDSKEDLFAAVLRREADRVYDDLRAVLDAHEADPATAVRRFMEVASDALVEEPLFRRTISREDRERLQSALTEADLESTRAEKRSLLVPYIEEWQRRGLVVDREPEILAMAILYVSSLPLHREAFGDESYPLVRDLLFRWVTASLTGV
jgi:AcrR family transcriptional regulator